MIRDRVLAGLERPQGGWQAPGQAEDDPIQRSAVPCCALDQGRGVRETAKVAEGIRRQGQRGPAHVGDHDCIGCRLMVDGADSGFRTSCSPEA